jgi:hypothetical protein
MCSRYLYQRYGRYYRSNNNRHNVKYCHFLHSVSPYKQKSLSDCGNKTANQISPEMNDLNNEETCAAKVVPKLCVVGIGSITKSALRGRQKTAVCSERLLCI